MLSKNIVRAMRHAHKRQFIRGCLTAIKTIVLVVLLLSSTANAVQNIPPQQQSGTNDCGPTAAAACLKWLQQNGYPNLKTSGNSGDIGDIKNEIQKDAKTDSKGTRTDRLRDAMNKMAKNSGYGHLRAKYPPNRNAYRDFGYLDTEFAHNEAIIILLEYTDSNGKKVKHYVATRNISGSGNTRTFEYMDPADGQNHTTTMTDAGNKLTMPYKGKTAKVKGILSMSPTNVTDSSSEKVSNGYKITYTPYFPPHKKAKDLHIWVSDCDPNNWEVSGLPAGWKWEVHHVTVNGKVRCYLSIYKNGSTNDLASGTDIEVTHKTSKKPKRYKRTLNQTTTGTNNPVETGGPPAESGYSVANTTPPEGRPRKVACTIMGGTIDSVTALLTWTPPGDPDIEQYEIYDESSGDWVGTSITEDFLLVDLESDVIHSYVVSARNFDDMLSEDSDPILIQMDASSAPEIVPGGPQILEYRAAFESCYECPPDFGWFITIPGATTAGNLYVITSTADPEIPPPPGVGHRHDRMYHFWTDAEIMPGIIHMEIPFSESDMVGPPEMLRAYALIGGTWLDITLFVDVARGMVICETPELAPIALYNGPWYVLGDFDGDGDVDQTDFDRFEGCATGPAMPYDPMMLSFSCEIELNEFGQLPADFDGDMDVDQNDFNEFQRCYSGENNPADPLCAN